MPHYSVIAPFFPLLDFLAECVDEREHACIQLCACFKLIMKLHCTASRATWHNSMNKDSKAHKVIRNFQILHVRCFSRQAIILARCSGAVTVSSLSTLRNLLGTSPEWFEPSPRITEAHDGGFLGLEVMLYLKNYFPRTVSIHIYQQSNCMFDAFVLVTS